jgi:translation initiation factor 2B subunit (eIF-2B alpha/beta/delta family)
MANQHSQSGGSSALTLIDETIRAFDQGQAASPQEGMSLLTDWFSSVKSDKHTHELMEPMQELRDELQSGAPNSTRLVQLLNELADLTESKTDQVDDEMGSRLTTLSTALRNFADQLSTAV